MAPTRLHGAAALAEFADHAKTENVLIETHRAGHVAYVQRRLKDPSGLRCHKGYELQFQSVDGSLAELAEWVADEGKCCPFFDFHIDLEKQGSLLCLRLTGEEGIKPFIRAEFQIASK